VGSILLKGLLGLVIVVAVVIGGMLAYRAWRQHEAAGVAAIRTPNGIDEERFVRIGGLDQWISIRGQDRRNPVLLMLDGGPGAAASPFVPNPWEKDFVVVEWDQPGAGRTFSRNGDAIDPRLGLDQVSGDGIDVAEYLRRHLHRSKVGIFASSWGTFIGIPMVKRRPDLFYAYVGTGQGVNFAKAEVLNYQHVLAKARARGDRRALAELTASGPPPYRSETAFRTQRKWAEAYEDAPSNAALISNMIFSPGYSLSDVRNWFAAFLASNDHFFGKAMDGPAMAIDLQRLGPDFQVPIFVYQGMEDDYAPYDLAKAYVDWIRAPRKRIVGVPGAGHYAAISRPDGLHELMLDDVRPLGLEADQVRP
jgi:pimeloyl-ACP methyl ester carboxylesterase